MVLYFSERADRACGGFAGTTLDIGAGHHFLNRYAPRSIARQPAAMKSLLNTIGPATCEKWKN